MQAKDPTKVLTIILGLAMTLFWAVGWEVASIWVFIFDVLRRWTAISARTFLIVKGVTRHPGLRETSVAYAQSNEPRRFLAQFGLARASEAAAWPLVTVLNIGFALAIRLLTPGRAKMTEDRTSHYVAFCCPPALVSLAAHGLQAWFLTTQFSPETQTSAVFKTAVALQIVGFVALGLHFLAQRKFMKNFSISGMSPFAYVAANVVLAIGAAAIVRIVAGVAFAGNSPTINGEALFQAVRALAINQDLFDIVDVLRNSANWHTFTNEFSAAVASITWLSALDAFLSAFVIVTPLRALWSSISYKRDDEDRRARVGHFLAAGRTAKARREADRMESVGEAASAKALAALCDGDYEDFVHQLELVDSSAQLAGVRRDPDALRHIHFMQAMSIAPINPEHFSDMLEALWQERARVASVLILSSEIAERHGGQAALEENAKGRSWGNALNEVFGLIEEHLKSGDQFAATLSERYSKEPLSLALSAVVAFQSFGSQMKNAARREAVRRQIVLALKEIVGRIESDTTIDGLAFAMLGNFYGAPVHFRAAFDADPTDWIAVIDALERQIVASGGKLTAAYGNIRSARFQ